MSPLYKPHTLVLLHITTHTHQNAPKHAPGWAQDKDYNKWLRYIASLTFTVIYCSNLTSSMREKLLILYNTTRAVNHSCRIMKTHSPPKDLSEISQLQTKPHSSLIISYFTINSLWFHRHSLIEKIYYIFASSNRFFDNEVLKTSTYA